MREIKFRAWNSEEKVMGTPFTIGQFCGAFPMADNIDTENIEYMQFTGLNDKNGVEVYESDIVTIIQAKRNYTVEYTDYGFKLIHANPMLNRMVWGGLHRLNELDFTIKVIGNIHEHPHLLNTSAY